jgi:iron complex transport system substrate-binding protein
MVEPGQAVARALFFLIFLTSGTPAFASRTVTDELGRTVVVPDRPHRVVCLAPSLTETVYELGGGDSIVGVSDYTTFPEAARSKPSVGNLTHPAVEKIIALDPDLVLLEAHINRQETIHQLEELSLPAFVVEPQGLTGILRMVRSVGDATNHSEEAESLVKRLSEKRDAVAARVKGQSRPKVLVVIWYEPVLTAGNKAFITDVIAAAGGESVTADIPQVWPQISMEEVVNRSPDFLLLIKELHGGITLDLLKSRAGWDRLVAVRDARVVYVDEKLELPSPSVFEALEELARTLHPAAFRGN